MYEAQRQNVDSFYTAHAIYSNKRIIIGYKIPNCGVTLCSYDFRLNIERERELDDPIGDTLDTILVSEIRLYLVRSTHRPTSHLIHEYDYEFNRMLAPFGQNKSLKKTFYIPSGNLYKNC